MAEKRRELAFQNHIIDSYKRVGGHAQKWASEWQANKPDLICSLPGVGLHLIEVKHIPEFGPEMARRVQTNNLTAGQRNECKHYLLAGARVWAGIIGSSSDARGATFALFDPLADKWGANNTMWVPYELKHKFNIEALVHNQIEREQDHA